MISESSRETFDVVSHYDYDLPPHLIAQSPLEPRDASRLLQLGKQSGAISHHGMQDLPDLLSPGDLLVANNSRVIPARLRGQKTRTGGQVELLLLNPQGEDRWEAMAKPARTLRPGTELTFLSRRNSESGNALIVQELGDGLVVVELDHHLAANLASYGELPLPPYIHRELGNPERYQTTYATEPGSAAAPTAGLHFTPELRSRLVDRQIGWAELTLHVGLGTFRPVAVDLIRDHRMHAESFSVSPETLTAVRETKANGGRVIGVGTTSARVLETIGLVDTTTNDVQITGQTSIFITPGHTWSLVDGMLTNFHLPRSTLLMMVSALASRDRIFDAYQQAIQKEYRFFSFGDAMLII